jgi:hypothetical protein
MFKNGVGTYLPPSHLGYVGPGGSSMSPARPAVPPCRIDGHTTRDALSFLILISPAPPFFRISNLKSET